jgi:ribokinase
MRLHVVGNVCVDTSFRLKRLPRAGETLNGTLTAEGVGGKGANQAVAAARAGADAWLWSAVGRDDVGRRLISLLDEDIRTDRILRLPLPTDRSTIIVDEAGENMIISVVPCVEALDPLRDMDLPGLWQMGDVLLMQGNLKTDATRQCMAAANKAGLTTILNPSPLGDMKIEFTAVDLLIANRQEAETLTGQADMEVALRHLLDLGVGTAIITLGAQGCLLAETRDMSPVRIKAPKVDTIDTSGAGECFAGVVAGLLSTGMALRYAARIATHVAAYATCQPGTIAAFPSRATMADIIHKAELENA